MAWFNRYRTLDPRLAFGLALSYLVIGGGGITLGSLGNHDVFSYVWGGAYVAFGLAWLCIGRSARQRVSRSPRAGNTVQQPAKQ